MTRRVSLFEFMPHGAPELLQGTRPHMARALTLGSALWCALFVTVLAVLAVVPKPAPIAFLPPIGPTVEITVTPTWEVKPPAAPPRTRVAPTRADRGTILPVPETAKLPPVVEARPANPDGVPGAGTEDAPISVVAPSGVGAEPEREIKEWEADTKPGDVKRVVPEYPELAQKAGVEGLVYVMVAVGPDGHVRRAEVLKGVPLLNQAALDAAWRWVFTPGLAKGHPVTVLVTIPFRFSLHNR